MENGVGVVEEIHVGEVKVGGDDGVQELKVEERVGGGSGVHGHKDSEGDEVFEEAVESSLDEGNDGVDGSKPDSEDVAVGVDVNGDSESGFFAAEGNTSPVDEGETIEDAVAGSDEGRDGVGDSVEVKEESLAMENNEGSLARLDESDIVANEEAPDVDERVVSQEAEPASVIDEVVIKESPSGGLQNEPLIVEEIKGVVGNEDVVEKFVVTEKSENGEAENMGGVDAGASPAEDVEVVTANGDVNHVNETTRELGDASTGISSEEQTERLEELKVSVAGNLNDYSSAERDGAETDGASTSISSEHPGNNGTASQDAMGDTSSEIEIDQTNDEGNQTKLLPEYQDGGSKVEVGSSEISALVDDRAMTSEVDRSIPLAASAAKNDVKSESVPTDLGTKNEAADTSQSVGDNQALAKGHAIEEKKTEEERQNGQASRETTVKPAQKPVSSSGKSANPTAPPASPAGLGRAAPLLEPAPRAAHQPRANGQVSQVQSSSVEDATNGENEEGDEIREKLQMIRVKFLRLAHRLGQTPHNVVVAQVLYRLGLAEQLRARNGGRVGAFSFDRASAMAEQLEATGREPLDFTCTIMVLGKTGVGKSATINSIFDEIKFGTDAFQIGTKKVQDVVGTVQGIKVRVIDTPGLLPSCSDQRQNEKILHSVKRFIKKSPPDIVLYLDRLDMPSRDFGDMPLLRTITDIFGPSIWFNAIVVLTHAASAPPEGPNGTASTYDMFVTQRSHAVQQAIRQAAGDMRLMNPVSLVENHSACRTNRNGQRVLPNGQVWKPHLLLLSFASKILAEANTLLKLQDTPPGKPFPARSRVAPLPLLLSTLLQSRPQLKLPEEQYGDDDAMDDDLDETSESDGESEYDELPPFRPLTKAQLAKLSRAQKNAYYDELEYREKLLMKKQLKEERRRRKLMKKMEEAAKDFPGEYSEPVEEESGAAAALPVPMPDLPLPASFDSDNPTHRYRYLDTSNQWLVRPVLDSHGWDRDVGYEGVNVERMFVVKDKTPLSLSGQITKDKKEASLQMEVASSIKHGEGKATTLAFDMQSLQKEMAYTLRSETRFSNYRHNKATAGVSATLLGDGLVSAGVKLEDKLIVNKQFRVVMSGGAMGSRGGDIAYGGSLEATLRDKDFPLGRFLSTLGLSVMDWHGELALGCNIQTQVPVGRNTNLIARANLNNRGTGQVSLRLNSSEHLQLALIGLLPLLRKAIGHYQEHPYGH